MTSTHTIKQQMMNGQSYALRIKRYVREHRVVQEGVRSLSGTVGLISDSELLGIWSEVSSDGNCHQARLVPVRKS